MNHRILFVEDNRAILECQQLYFTARGYTVGCARSVSEAQACLRHKFYSIVLTDIHLKGNKDLEGLRLVDYLRTACPQSTPVPTPSSGLVLLRPTGLIFRRP